MTRSVCRIAILALSLCVVCQGTLSQAAQKCPNPPQSAPDKTANSDTIPNTYRIDFFDR